MSQVNLSSKVYSLQFFFQTSDNAYIGFRGIQENYKQFPTTRHCHQQCIYCKRSALGENDISQFGKQIIYNITAKAMVYAFPQRLSVILLSCCVEE